METIKVDILNPEAKKALNDLVDRKLISIRSSAVNRFSEVLGKLRSEADSIPDLDEITREVEDARAMRYKH